LSRDICHATHTFVIHTIYLFDFISMRQATAVAGLGALGLLPSGSAAPSGITINTGSGDVALGSGTLHAGQSFTTKLASDTDNDLDAGDEIRFVLSSITCGGAGSSTHSNLVNPIGASDGGSDTTALRSWAAVDVYFSRSGEYRACYCPIIILFNVH
jgi:hypothetical protein